MSDKVTSDIVMSSIRDVTLWFGCKSLDSSSSSCFCCIFIFYVFMPMMSSHWKLIRRRLLSELQLRFNFCTNVLFSGIYFIYLFFSLSHKCEYCRGLFSPTVQRLSESTCLCWTFSSQCVIVIFLSSWSFHVSHESVTLN